MKRGMLPKRLRPSGLSVARGLARSLAHGRFAATASGGQPEPPSPPPFDDPDDAPIGEPPGPIPVPPAPEAPPMQLRAAPRSCAPENGPELPWMLRPTRPGFKTRPVASR